MEKLIYILDDCANMLHLYKKIISIDIWPKVKIRTFKNENELIFNIDSVVPSLIIMDLIRPDSIGLDFVDVLNKKINKFDTRILIASGNTINYIAKLFNNDLDFLAKPFTRSQLIDKVRFALLDNIPHKKNEKSLDYIFAKIFTFNETLKSINYKFDIKYGIKPFIKWHDSNNIDIFQLPSTLEELNFHFSVIWTFFERFHISSIADPKIVWSLNKLQVFLDENNINIEIWDIRDIIKLRNTYPNHLNDKQLTKIYKKWNIEDIKDYQKIWLIALEKVIHFLEELDLRL